MTDANRKQQQKKTPDAKGAKEKQPDPNRADILRCSFCNKSQRDVKKLIAGPAVYICDECVDTCLDIISEDPIDRPPSAVLPASILQAGDDVMPAHETVKRAIGAALAAHASLPRLERLSGLMIAGPTGSGKNQLVEAMTGAAELALAVIEVPLLFPDAPFKAKLQLTDFDTKAGVIVLNHIDTLAMKGDRKDECRRIQQSLISIIDGTWIQLGEEAKRGFPPSYDTTKALFIGIGAFPDVPSGEPFGPELLIRHGFLPELVARFGSFLRLEPLSEAEMTVLLTRRGGLISGCTEHFSRHGLRIGFDPSAVERIVLLGARRKAGVRGLKAMIDRLGIAIACENFADAQQELRVDAAYVTRHLG